MSKYYKIPPFTLRKISKNGFKNWHKFCLRLIPKQKYAIFLAYLWGYFFYIQRCWKNIGWCLTFGGIDFTYKTLVIFTKLSLIISFTFTKNAYYPLLIKMLKCIWFKITSPLRYHERTLRETDVIKNNENTSRVSFTESSKWTVFITFTKINRIESNMCCSGDLDNSSIPKCVVLNEIKIIKKIHT